MKKRMKRIIAVLKLCKPVLFLMFAIPMIRQMYAAKAIPEDVKLSAAKAA
jgi:hypothetical protein